MPIRVPFQIVPLRITGQMIGRLVNAACVHAKKAGAALERVAGGGAAALDQHGFKTVRSRVPLGTVLMAAMLSLPASADEIRTFSANDMFELLGQTIRIEPPDGKSPQEIGRLVDVLVDGTGQPLAAVLDVGGFLGVGSRKVAVMWTALRFDPPEQTRDKFAVTLTLPADRIRAAPDYKGAGKPVEALSP